MKPVFYKGRVKEYINEQGLDCHKTVYDEVDYQIKRLLRIACERAKKNDRTTVMERDI